MHILNKKYFAVVVIIVEFKLYAYISTFGIFISSLTHFYLEQKLIASF